MKSMKQIGTSPTPYGVTVAIYEHQTDRDEFILSGDGAAKMAGIYDAKQRENFTRSLARGDALDPAKFGGQKVPRLKIPRPLSPVYPTLPRIELPIEAWVTRALDSHRWCDRADTLIEIIGGNIAEYERQGAGETMLLEVSVYALQLLLTATLENLAESEIDCLEAASMYALSMHPDWRNAGLKWLQPFRHTWFKDWTEQRPDYRKFARMCVALSSNFPKWIAGGHHVG